MRRGSGKTYILLAMPPSGEVFVARDTDGRLWLITPPGGGGPIEIDDTQLQRAVAEHGYERIDRGFASWEELDRERQRLAGLVAPATEVDVASFDIEDVERVLNTARRRQREGHSSQARRIALRLLEAPVLLTVPDQHAAVVKFLQDLDATPAALPPSSRDAYAARRARMALVA
jgi:hypothetical protein